MVDGQMQRHRAVAAVGGIEVLHVVAGLRVNGVVPCEGFADGLAPLGSGVVVQRQMQRDDGVTLVGGGEGLQVVSRSCISHLVPGVTVAAHILLRNSAIMLNKFQSLFSNITKLILYQKKFL